MTITKKEVVEKIKKVTASAPSLIKSAAAAFINSISDQPSSFEFDLDMVNDVWNEDLPPAARGKYNLK